MPNLKLGAVSYSNTLPLIHFLEKPYTTDTPARLVQQTLDGHLDVALLPVASILEHNLQAYPEAGLIGCNGPVASVGFFTRPHIETLSDIQTLYLDTESRTSVNLALMILKRAFHRNLKSIQRVSAAECHRADAQVLIGDKALFFQEPGYKFHDLGELWQQHTGAGFIFACWASKKPLPRTLISELAEARDKGLQNLLQIAESQIDAKRRPIVLSYWQNNIVYKLDDSLKKGFDIFSRRLREDDFFRSHHELNTFYRYANHTDPKPLFQA